MITLGKISLIRHKKNTATVSAQSTNILTQHTSIENSKIKKKIIKIPYFLTFFLTTTKHDTKKRAETNVTNIYELIQQKNRNKRQTGCNSVWVCGKEG